MSPHSPRFIEVTNRLLLLHPHFAEVSQGFTLDLQDFSLSWEINLQSKYHMHFRAALLLTEEEKTPPYMKCSRKNTVA